MLSMELTNRERILELRREDPQLAAVRIAEMLSISRERVRQILEGEGLPTAFYKDYGICTICGEVKPGPQQYCSKKCSYEAHRVRFNCALCGESKQLLRSQYNAQVRRGYERMYCSRLCRNRGKWVFKSNNA